MVSVLAALYLLIRPKDLDEYAKFADIVTVVGVWIGGGWALYRFGYERRVRVGDVLIRLHQDYRRQLKSLSKIEHEVSYKELEKDLERTLTQPLGVCREPPLTEIDAVLVHFLLVYSLDANQQLDRDSVLVDYRYYGALLLSDFRILLRVYIHRYYPTLAGFLENLKIFPDDGRFSPQRAISPDEVKNKLNDFRGGNITGEQLVTYFKNRAAGKAPSQASTP